MKKILYLNFDLLIEPVGERYRAKVLDSPCGEAETVFSFPFSNEKLENFYLRIGRPRRGVRRLDSAEMQAAKEMGGRLFNVALGGEVYAAFFSSLEQAQSQNCGLRVRLRLNAPELANLPWEYLYEARTNHFLCLSVDTPLVRYLELPYPARTLQVQLPLRMLVMIAGPSDFPALNVAEEWDKLNSAVAPLVARGVLRLERTPAATLDAEPGPGWGRADPAAGAGLGLLAASGRAAGRVGLAVGAHPDRHAARGERSERNAGRAAGWPTGRRRDPRRDHAPNQPATGEPDAHPGAAYRHPNCAGHRHREGHCHFDGHHHRNGHNHPHRDANRNRHANRDRNPLPAAHPRRSRCAHGPGAVRPVRDGQPGG